MLKYIIILFLVFLLSIIYLQGFFLKSKGINDFCNKDSLISDYDTIKIMNINTYLGCQFVIRNIGLTNNYFKINGKMPVDNNHIFPGIGQINVVAFVYSNKLDLRDSKILLEYHTTELNLNLHFWFQVKRKNKRISNFMTVLPISKYSIYRNGYYLVNLPINQIQFQCMGTSFVKRRVYGCDIPVEDALGNVNIDFGLINMHNYFSFDECTDVNLIIKNFQLVNVRY